LGLSYCLVICTAQRLPCKGSWPNEVRSEGLQVSATTGCVRKCECALRTVSPSVSFADSSLIRGSPTPQSASGSQLPLQGSLSLAPTLLQPAGGKPRPYGNPPGFCVIPTSCRRRILCIDARSQTKNLPDQSGRAGTSQYFTGVCLRCFP